MVGFCSSQKNMKSKRKKRKRHLGWGRSSLLWAGAAWDDGEGGGK